MAQDLRPHARLAPQARDGDERGEHAAQPGQPAPAGASLVAYLADGVGQEQRVVAREDVHGQIGMREGELVEELALVGRVDRVPQRPAAAQPGVEVLGRGLAGGSRLETGLDRGGQGVAEGVEGVYGAGDAVEGDALEADFADQLGGLDGGRPRGG